MSTLIPVEVIAQALASKLTEELGWDWKGEQFEDVCMRGGSMSVPSGEQVIRELAESLASVIAALPDIAIVSHADIREMIEPSREVDNCPKCNETVAWEKNGYDLRDNDDNRYSWVGYCETCSLHVELTPFPNPPIAAAAAEEDNQ